jgi:hypothetical protein
VVNSIVLEPGVREEAGVAGGGRKSRREYWEFVVDGEPLGARLGPMIGLSNVAVDFVPVLVLNWPIGFPAQDFDPLIGRSVPPLPGSRVPLYVCAECGDLGCGAVTVIIDWTETNVVWRDFGYQNDYEPFTEDDVFTGVGPFEFDRARYEAVLEQFADRWVQR